MTANWQTFLLAGAYALITRANHLTAVPRALQIVIGEDVIGLSRVRRHRTFVCADFRFFFDLLVHACPYTTREINTPQDQKSHAQTPENLAVSASALEPRLT